ncbi:M56 family metallopeptidase [Mycolicibacterium rhodesiae]|nr:M56 family metallopeptidase [Mycolicibacterium rhodesiae]MCV7346053.1 M56 family metallopeptidase [Mycolicibacterium rhodesiae]
MSAMFVLAVVGLAIGIVGPSLLRAMVTRGVEASLVVAVWALTMCATVISIALPVLGELVRRCWLASREVSPGGVDLVAAVVSALLLGFAVARGGWVLWRSGRERHRLHGRHVELARLLTGARPDAGGVLWLPASEPLAYSVAGTPPLVVLTSGLTQRLDRAAVDAVLAHERSHLRRGHHLLVDAAHAAAAGMGWLPLMRQSPSLIRTLVELDADVQAARQHGCGGLRRALEELAGAPAPRAALGMTGECTRLRLARLESGRSTGRGPLAGLATAACGAALLGSMLAFVAFTMTALVSCAAF